MIQNPFLPSPPQAAAWAEGFTRGFVGTVSVEPGENIGAEDVDAFNLGVEAGIDAGSNGLAPLDPCVSALDEHGPLHGVHIGIDGAHLLHGAWHLGKLAVGMAGIVVGLVGLAMSLPLHTLPPDEVLPSLGQPLVDALASMGLDSLEIFCAAGLDATIADCEILLTPLFSSFDAAREAAIALERPEWLVASWRTDQSNSFRIVDVG